jgi:VIT1/CCC1 family predicted Fe2+/Mn2+ transporter
MVEVNALRRSNDEMQPPARAPDEACATSNSPSPVSSHPSGPAARPTVSSTGDHAIELMQTGGGEVTPFLHDHYSQRAPWLRAFVLGANDGLVVTSSLMLGFSGSTDELAAIQLAGVASWIAGALSMALGEYVSVSSQRDCEQADIAKERLALQAAPEWELQELTDIYISRGLSAGLAHQVAEELSARDVVRAHARDELGIDMDELANPLQAALVSALAFSVGAGIPLLAGSFLREPLMRLISVVVAAIVGLMIFGGVGAWLGGASIWRGSLRVVLGGAAAMGITYGIGYAFSSFVH